MYKREKVVYSILMFLIFAILLPPAGVSSVFPVAILSCYKIMQLFLFIVAAILFLVEIRKYTTSTYISIAYLIVVYFSSYIFRDVPVNLTPFIIMALIIYITRFYRKQRKILYHSITLYLEIILYVSLILRILKPSMFSFGDFDYWWFGHKNYVVRFLLPLVCFSMLYSLEKHKSVFSARSVVDSVLTGLSIVLSHSATGIVGFTFLMGFIVLFEKTSMPHFFSINIFILISMVVFCLIYVFHIQTYFEFFIVNILDRKLDFTGRTYIWNIAVEQIKENPIFGVGAYNDMTFLFTISTHAHQYWLQNIIMGGFVGTTILVAIYVTSSINITKYRFDKGAKVLIITVCAFLVMGIDESLKSANMLIPIAVLAGTYKSERFKYEDIILNNYRYRKTPISRSKEKS